MTSARRLALAAGLVLAAGGASAGLFDDDEARRAILDVRTRLQALEEGGKARNAEQADQIAQLRRSLLELNGQLEALRTELAKTRGQNEQLARDLAELQRGQKDLQQGVDTRLRKVEPQKVSVDGREFLADPEEKRQFEEAMGVLRGGDFAAAAGAYSGFLQRYPGSGYAESARFWLGNAQYGKRDYKGAIATFRSFVAAAPEHPRAPEALLALANCQIELKDTKSARRTLDEVLKTYPKSEAAQAAKERLASLKQG
ncbi:MAG: tol-pal system protein YbgF [Betaproteobacteria bacterium]|nr:MAG: tol-pal system protein YbgF [Betaproteobacteria bacterium]